MTTTERELVTAISDVTDEIDDSQNYLNRERFRVDDVLELLRGIRSRLEHSIEGLSGVGPTEL